MSCLNRCSLSLFSWFSIAISLSLIGSIRGLLPFSGVMFTIFCWKLMSCHCSIVASPILIPVSFSICNSVAVTVPIDAISWSISVSVGMNGSLSAGLYVGCSHVFFMNFKNPV